MTYHLENAQATQALGAQLAQQLQAGDVLALHGELGAGKTTLVQGIAHGLGSQIPVTSPTFPLLQEYTDGNLAIAHFDWYRLEVEDELWNLGWEEFLDYPGIVIVEWSERFPKALPQHAIHWHLSHPQNQQETAQRRVLEAP